MTVTWTRAKEWLIGSPIPSSEHEHQLLPKVLALPVFAADRLSSVAYATEEVVLVLAPGGTAGLGLISPVALGIAALMVMVVTSYRQTVRAYPDGGGAFIVAHDNLGMKPATVAAASLLTDYVLTVAVSISAGVAAITSAAPSLVGYKGADGPWASSSSSRWPTCHRARESGSLFAAPTYAFVVIVAVTLGTGFVRCLSGACPKAASAGAELAPGDGRDLLVPGAARLRLRGQRPDRDRGHSQRGAGVPQPKAHNAATTLGIMGAVAVTMGLGIGIQAHLFDVRITEGTLDTYGTVLSQIGRGIFGGGAGFIILQTATVAILVLAANAAYQDFPRLSAILAGHRLMPRQFRNRGDRLAFSNGIVIVSVLASVLIVAFGAQVSRLIQLYVVGVFTSFTLARPEWCATGCGRETRLAAVGRHQHGRRHGDRRCSSWWS